MPPGEHLEPRARALGVDAPVRLLRLPAVDDPTSVVPDKDAVVEVAMKPAAAPAPATAAADEGAKPAAGHKAKKKKDGEGAPAAATAPSPPAGKDISEGRRGALMTDKFE